MNTSMSRGPTDSQQPAKSLPLLRLAADFTSLFAHLGAFLSLPELLCLEHTSRDLRRLIGSNLILWLSKYNDNDTSRFVVCVSLHLTVENFAGFLEQVHVRLPIQQLPKCGQSVCFDASKSVNVRNLTR